MHFSSRPSACILGFALLISFWLPPITNAAPTDDLTNAVARGGAASVTEASAKQFLRAYMSILVRAKPKEVIWYVNAAVKLRPDLASKIVVVTLNVRRLNTNPRDLRDRCRQIGDIIQAAIMASAEAGVAIVKAAVATEPFARECIIAAARAASPDQNIAFLEAARESELAAAEFTDLTVSLVSIPAIGTINPADYTRPHNVISPEQPPPLP